MHQSPSREMVARGTPLHHVGRQSEGRTTEGNERCPCRPHRSSETIDHSAHGSSDGLESRTHPNIGMRRIQAFHRRPVTHGSTQNRARSRLDLHVDAGQPQGAHDVGEENRGIHSVAANRLQGRLDDKPRIHTSVQHRQATTSAQRSVLRQRSTRLPHKPHGRACRPAPVERAQQQWLIGPPPDRGIVDSSIVFSDKNVRSFSESGVRSFSGVSVRKRLSESHFRPTALFDHAPMEIDLNMPVKSQDPAIGE